MSIKSTLYACSPAFLQAIYQRVEASPLGYRLAKGAFWSLAGAVIARGLGLLSGIVVARLLGKTEFGQLGMVQNTVGMFGTLAGFSLGLTATKYVAQFKITNPGRAGRIMGLASLVAWVSGGLATVLLFILAPWLAARTLGAPHLSSLLQLGSVLLLLGGVSGAQTGALAGFEAFKIIARASLITGVLSFPITIACAVYLGVRGAVWAQILTLGCNVLLNFLALRREAARMNVPLGYDRCWREWPILWSFSLPAVLGGALAGPVAWISSALLVNQTNGYAEMGIYNAAMRMKSVPELVLSMVMAPLLPVLSEQFGRNQTEAYNKTLRYAFGLSLLLIVPASLIQIAAPGLTMLPYGSSFREDSGAVVQWLMVHAAFLGIFYPFGSILLSMNRTWFGFWYNVGYSALLLVLAAFLIPRTGGAGLASATALSYAGTSVVCVLYIYRRERAFVGNVVLWPAIAGVFISIAAFFALHHFLPPVSATVSAFLVVGTLVTAVLWRAHKRGLV